MIGSSVMLFVVLFSLVFVLKVMMRGSLRFFRSKRIWVWVCLLFCLFYLWRSCLRVSGKSSLSVMIEEWFYLEFLSGSSRLVVMIVMMVMSLMGFCFEWVCWLMMSRKMLSMVVRVMEGSWFRIVWLVWLECLIFLMMLSCFWYVLMKELSCWFMIRMVRLSSVVFVSLLR